MRSKILLPAGLLAAALAAGGCVSSSDIEGLHSQISDVQSQVQAAKVQAPSKQDVAALDAQVSRQMESLLKTEADMQVKLQSLTSHIDELQSKLEDTNYRLSQLSQQIAATNQELKGSRGAAPVPAPGDLGAPPAAGAPAGAGGLRSGAPAGANTGAAAPSQVVNDPKALYDSAYNDYLKGNYDLAMREFQEYLNDFPDTDLASNATYWIGESHYRQKRYRQAADQFDQVLQRYPHSEKRASALLKKGYSQLALGERSAGVASLRQVVRQHPTSDEANLARQRLRELGG